MGSIQAFRDIANNTSVSDSRYVYFANGKEEGTDNAIAEKQTLCFNAVGKPREFKKPTGLERQQDWSAMRSQLCNLVANQLGGTDSTAFKEIEKDLFGKLVNGRYAPETAMKPLRKRDIVAVLAKMDAAVELGNVLSQTRQALLALSGKNLDSVCGRTKNELRDVLIALPKLPLGQKVLDAVKHEVVAFAATEAGRATLENLVNQKAFKNFHVALASYAPELAKLTVKELDERMRTSTTRMNISYSSGKCKGPEMKAHLDKMRALLPVMDEIVKALGGQPPKAKALMDVTYQESAFFIHALPYKSLLGDLFPKLPPRSLGNIADKGVLPKGPKCTFETRKFLVNVLASYGEHEKHMGKDEHGRTHATRAFIFANVMGNILKEKGLKVDVHASALMAAGHDCARQDDGTDIFEHASADKMKGLLKERYLGDGAGNGENNQYIDDVSSSVCTDEQVVNSIESAIRGNPTKFPLLTKYYLDQKDDKMLSVEKMHNVLIGGENGKIDTKALNGILSELEEKWTEVYESQEGNDGGNELQKVANADNAIIVGMTRYVHTLSPWELIQMQQALAGTKIEALREKLTTANPRQLEILENFSTLVSAQLTDKYASALPPYQFPDVLEMSKVKVLNDRIGGSTGAKLIEISGRKYIMKQPDPKKSSISPEHIRNEVVADQIYRLAGGSVPDSKFYQVDGKTIKLSQYIPEGQTLNKWWKSATAEQREQMKKVMLRDFSIDVFVGGYDVLGAVLDNVLVDKDGKPWRVDNGASFEFRARGARKDSERWNERQWPDEWQTMRVNHNNHNEVVFGGYSAYRIFKAAQEFKFTAIAESLPAEPAYEQMKANGLDLD